MCFNIRRSTTTTTNSVFYWTAADEDEPIENITPPTAARDDASVENITPATAAGRYDPVDLVTPSTTAREDDPFESITPPKAAETDDPVQYIHGIESESVESVAGSTPGTMEKTEASEITGMPRMAFFQYFYLFSNTFQYFSWKCDIFARFFFRRTCTIIGRCRNVRFNRRIFRRTIQR